MYLYINHNDNLYLYYKYYKLEILVCLSRGSNGGGVTTLNNSFLFLGVTNICTTHNEAYSGR